ncbi:MAG: PAS domain-containing protein [Thermoanaerobaculia bacterium]|nr:PAS domain-containing protein [Thermoanaerobaculia bacterium]
MTSSARGDTHGDGGSTAQLVRTLASAGIGTFTWRGADDSASWDAAQERLFGRPCDRRPGHGAASFYACIHPDDRERAQREAALAAATRGAYRVEFRALHPDGAVVWVLEHGYAERDAAGAIAGITGVCFDISERKRMESELTHREQLLREAGEMARVGGWEFDPATGEGSWTAETARIHDVETGDPASVRRGLEFFRGESRRRIEAAVGAAVERGEPYDLELEMVTARGVTKWVRTIGTPEVRDGRVVRVRGSMQDITDRVRLESELRQSQKLEAIGRLAGGIAHDFNNLLTVIGGSGELLARALPPEGPQQTLLLEIRDAAGRAAALTRQLLAFGRSQVLSPQVVELNAAVAHAGSMLRRLIGEDIDLVSRLAPDAGHVRVDPGQLDQVILNLAVNARDAMPRGGRLTLETAAVELDAAFLARAPDLAPGAYARLTVRDDGVGMPPEVLAKAFEPFFTTKGPGQGSGLGLSTVFGIVKQSGGHVEGTSAVGAGTCFEIVLPRVAAERPAESPVAAARGETRGRETILLVEDEESLRKLAVVALEGNGYRVLSAGNGRDALELAARQAEGGVDLLLTDLVMPGMGGRDLAALLRADRPGLRVVFMSGYAEDAANGDGIAAAEGAYLSKPFSLAQLAATVRAALDVTD